VRHKDIDPELGLPMEKLAWMQDMLIKNGSMPKPVDLAKVVAPDVRAKALERAKKGDSRARPLVSLPP